MKIHIAQRTATETKRSFLTFAAAFADVSYARFTTRLVQGLMIVVIRRFDIGRHCSLSAAPRDRLEVTNSQRVLGVYRVGRAG